MKGVGTGIFFALLAGCAQAPEPSPLWYPLRARVAMSLPTKPRATAVCVGSNHSCALTEEGEVACWGLNDRRQIDASDDPQIEAPRRIDGIPAAQRIACGPEVTCALSREGDVACWGGGKALHKVKMMERATDLTVGAWGGCVVTDEGKVACWSSYDDARTVVVEGIEDARATVRGDTSALACVTRGSNPPTCFEPRIDLSPPRKVEMRDPDPPRVRTMSLSERERMVGATELLLVKGPRLCGLFADGKVQCDGVLPSPFGEARWKSLSSASDDRACGTSIDGRAICGNDAIPSDVMSAQISVHHGCGLTSVGRVRCWGVASSGQLGDGSRFVRGEPRRVPNVADAVSLGVSTNLACVARKGGKVTCWGRLGEEDPLRDPFDVETPEPTLEVAVNASSQGRLCVRGSAGWKCLYEDWVAVPSTVRPLAQPPSTRLVMDDGRTADWEVRKEVTAPDFFAKVGLRIKHLSSDGYCGVDDRGRLVCGHCGGCDDAKAALTVFDGETFLEATSLMSDANEITEACGLTTQGRVTCRAADAVPWSRAEAIRSVPIGGQTLARGVHVVGSGGRYDENLTCVLSVEGEVGCFGSDRFHQRGGAEEDDGHLMTRIEGLPAVREIGVGGSFACARTESGEVYCWGSNRAGAAPDGTPLSRPLGVSVRLPSPSHP